MCGGSKKAAAPVQPPVSVAASPRNIADNSNDVQRKSAVVAATTQAPTTFGSELGNATGAPV